MSISDIIAAIKDGWFQAESASPELVSQMQSQLAVRLPLDYLEFIRWSNGGEGKIGNHYFSPWPLQNIRELNAGYHISKYLPGLMIVGDDLGPFCYAFDYRTDPYNPEFVIVPYGHLDIASIEVLGSTFAVALESWLLE